ncbi:MAG TPA: universal stress protein [Vicinamibacterales bacterium]
MDIPLSRILVPTDFNEKAQMALSYGVTLAERFGSTLHVLHVVEAIVDVAQVSQEQLDGRIVDGTWNELNKLLSADDRKRLNVTFAIEWGVPFAEIIRYARARQIELIVMGTHGSGAVKRLILGSVAENVVRSAPCPVLTVGQAPSSARDAAA